MSESDHHRSIRRYVRRSGRLTPAQERALDELWPRYGIEATEEPLDLAAAFGREAPCVLEIGFGNGETLVEQAAADPGRNYIGIEVHEPGVGHCLLHIERAGIENLRLVSSDALEVLEHAIPDGALAQINLYFPDPWPKKRHHKRRIVTPAFMELAARKLGPGGQLHIATDWANYAEHIDEIVARSASFACIERRTHAGDAPLERPTTKFERRGLEKGHEIFDWELRRN